MQDKKANFKISKARELVDFINLKFKETTDEKLPDGVVIRSESSCRRDLLRWGAKYEKIKKRPYFLGHEREDVIQYRNEFVKKFENNKKFLQKI
jgi:hypothetical protein